MDIDVFGSIFQDTYIEGDVIHQRRISDGPGGSAFGVAVILHHLGLSVRFFTTTADHDWSEKMAKIAGFPTSSLHLRRHPKGEIPHCIYLNGQAIAVQRGVGKMVPGPALPELRAKACFVTTEIENSLLITLAKNYATCFVDIGPRPVSAMGINAFSNVITLGNAVENTTLSCNIIKGADFASWEGTKINIPVKTEAHPIGRGDVFDAILIACALQNYDKTHCLTRAIRAADLCQSNPRGGLLTRLENIASFFPQL